jgi:hypothetical protein
MKNTEKSITGVIDDDPCSHDDIADNPWLFKIKK